jgi:hypothetical protein
MGKFVGLGVNIVDVLNFSALDGDL